MMMIINVWSFFHFKTFTTLRQTQLQPHTKKNDMKQNEHIIERAPTHPIATTIVTKSF